MLSEKKFNKTLKNLDEALNKMFAKIGTDIGTIQGEIETIKQRIKINYENLDERITNLTIDQNSEYAELDGKLNEMKAIVIIKKGE